MTERQEIIETIEQAILAHETNLVHAELKKAKGNPAADLDAVISYAGREIDRLRTLKARMGNNDGRVTQRDRTDKLSAQMGEMQAQIIGVNGTLKSQNALLNGIKTTVETIERECPLFRPDLENGVLTFVRNKPNDSPSVTTPPENQAASQTTHAPTGHVSV